MNAFHFYELLRPSGAERAFVVARREATRLNLFDYNNTIGRLLASDGPKKKSLHRAHVLGAKHEQSSVSCTTYRCG